MSEALKKILSPPPRMRGRTIEALADVIKIDVRVSTMEVDFFKVVANRHLTPAQIMVLLKSAVDP